MSVVRTTGIALASRRDNGVGMLIESDDERDGLMAPSIANCLPDDLLVSQVDAIEKADCQTHFFAGRLQFAGGADELHRLAVCVQ